MIGYSANLTMFVSEDTAGSYTCQVTVPGYRTIQAAAQVRLEGPPTPLRLGPGPQQGEVGETGELRCGAVAVPSAEAVVWSYRERVVSGRGGRHRVVTTRDRDKIISTLTIQQTRPADFGQYNCTVRNRLGENWQLVELVQTGK